MKTPSSVKSETNMLTARRRLANSRSAKISTTKNSFTGFLGIGLALVNIVAWGFALAAIVHH